MKLCWEAMGGTLGSCARGLLTFTPSLRLLRLEAMVPGLKMASKSFLANMDSNPLTQSGRIKGSFCASTDWQAPSASFWEVIEAACRSSAVEFKRILAMKSQSPGSYSASRVQTGASSSSESSAYSEEGPDQQILRALVFILFRNACSFCITQNPLHRGGHQFICTSLVCQLTSRLWFLSQV